MRQELHDARALAIMECAEAGLNPFATRLNLGLTYQTVRKYAEKYGIEFAQPLPKTEPAPKRDWVKLVQECVEKGLTRDETATFLEVSYSKVCQIARGNGIEFQRAEHLTAEQHSVNQHRADIMATLYRDGYTLQQIADQYGITRERVRQVISKFHGLNGSDGGRHITAEKSAVKRQTKKDAECFKRWGCTYAQWRSLLAIGQEMVATGRSIEQTPTRAYASQKHNASRRGIEFQIALLDWWNIWQASGHWNERGRGQGYVMCRVNDEGPYAVGNVFIDTAINNCSQAPKKKKSGLPTGVSKIVRGNYVAYSASRRIRGQSLYLGSHKTPELAHAAYLMAGAA